MTISEYYNRAEAIADIDVRQSVLALLEEGDFLAARVLLGLHSEAKDSIASWKQQIRSLIRGNKVPSREELAYTVVLLVQTLDLVRQHAKKEYYWKATGVLNSLEESGLIDWEK